MEGETYYCPACGAIISTDKIDFKRRQASCMFCGQVVRFPKRHTLNSPSATLALEEAEKLFMSGNFDSAKSCAETVLTMSTNNAAALFIVSYCKAHADTCRDSKALVNYFETTWKDSIFEIEEEEICKRLIKKTIFHSGEFEQAILEKFDEYDDPNELGEFVENYSPMLIASRQDIDWFTPKMFETYLGISMKVNLPKTWYALYSAITKNPDSPIAANTFFLKTKTQRFYNDFVLKVGEIFARIKDPALKAKFYGAYIKLKTNFEQHM